MQFLKVVVVGVALVFLVASCKHDTPKLQAQIEECPELQTSTALWAARIDPCNPTPDPTPDPTAATLGQWSPVMGLPLVPVSGALLPNGKVLMWAAVKVDSFSSDGVRDASTESIVFDPVTGAVTSKTVTETQHQMFCPGTAFLADGRLLINGGSSDKTTTLYDYQNNTWTRSANMTIGRGYQSSVTLADGGVFTLGGSWGKLNRDIPGWEEQSKDGEVWSPTSATWRSLPGADARELYKELIADGWGKLDSDNHAWLFQAPNGSVFQAGPSPHMHWYHTHDLGAVEEAGTRGSDAHSMNGNAVMYDVGKILKVGGARKYTLEYNPQNVPATATNRSFVIDINNGVSVREVTPMTYARTFANSVILPDGKVMTIGGIPVALTFRDTDAVLTPEIWNPVSETWSLAAPHQIPRNYHSMALLLPDGRVLAGGGGLCTTNPADPGNKCTETSNHLNMELYSPPYLFVPDGTLATRPVIAQVTPTVGYNKTFSAEVNTASPISKFTLVRLSSVTHSINTDQRFLVLNFTQQGNQYVLTSPASGTLAPPGFYMLFAIDSAGVPSVAAMLQLGTEPPAASLNLECWQERRSYGCAASVSHANQSLYALRWQGTNLSDEDKDWSVSKPCTPGATVGVRLEAINTLTGNQLVQMTSLPCVDQGPFQ